MLHSRLSGVGLVLAIVSLPAFASSIQEGDRHYAGRAEETTGEPVPGAIDAAIDVYRSVVEAEPGNLEAQWKLIRSLRFKLVFLLREDLFATRVAEESRVTRARWNTVRREAIEVAEESSAALDIVLREATGDGLPRIRETLLYGTSVLAADEIESVAMVVSQVPHAPELLYQLAALRINLGYVREKELKEYSLEVPYVAVLCLMMANEEVREGSVEVPFVVLSSLRSSSTVQMQGEKKFVWSRDEAIRHLRTASNRGDRWAMIYLAKELAWQEERNSFRKDREVIRLLRTVAAMELRPSFLAEDRNARETALEMLYNDAGSEPRWSHHVNRHFF